MPLPGEAGLRNLLVMAEVALAFVIAVGTGLLAKSFLQLTAVDAGFDPHQVLTLSPAPTPPAATRHPKGCCAITGKWSRRFAPCLAFSAPE